MKAAHLTFAVIVTLLYGGFAMAQDVPATDSAAMPATNATPEAKITVTGTDGEAATSQDAPGPQSATGKAASAIDAQSALASASETLNETATGQVDTQGHTGQVEIEKDIQDQLALLKPQVDVNLMPSLFFTRWEHDLLVEARKGLTTRPANAPDDGTGLSTNTNNLNGVPSGPREIYLGGIVYVSSKDWTIWVNGLRVTPTALPAPIMDIKVFKDYVEMDWLDASTNRIFPIRLRTQQRFNLDTKMFLQGQG